YRAFPRSRLPPSKTLTPFLYQTSTLQQWPQPIARRDASSRPQRRFDRDASSRPQRQFEHDVPFEGDALPPTLEEAERARQSTTITGSERAAFEKLYKNYKAPENEGRGANAGPPELDQIADEWYEDDEEKMKDMEGSDLDSLFDAAIAGKPLPHNLQNARRKKKKPDDLASLAKDILRPEQDEVKRKLKQVAAQRTTNLKAVQQKERERIQVLIGTAQTDKELWQTLETEVLGVIKALNLDETNKKGKALEMATRLPTTLNPDTPRFPTSPIDSAFHPPSVATPSPRDLRVLFHNYPYHIVLAVNLLRANFPSSPLPFAVIPTLKSHGRSAYALGATTQLYKVIIRATWHQHASYNEICALLQDMDNGGIECDMSTLNLINEILNEWDLSRSGRLGKGVQAVFRMEVFTEGVHRLRAWKEVVAKRLGAWSETRRREGGMVRKV
ncbi:hypothetical protein P280DRAFT_378438, partial [Massarina eburnea CBS 473.64]